jgi:hypothetical protein
MSSLFQGYYYDPKGGPATNRFLVLIGVRKGERDAKVQKTAQHLLGPEITGRLARSLHRAGCDIASTGHSSFGLG